MIGRTFGHYCISEKLGAGGMGIVYRAYDEHLERDVALKVLPAGTLADEGARSRFRSEALALSKLNHPNIATVHDFNSADGVDFLVMEYIPGATLADRSPAGALPEAEVIRLGRQAAAALLAAHEQGVIHRDLKPGNIMVTPKGLVKVLDFGLARFARPPGEPARTLTLDGSTALAGTLPYMAPEQLNGGETDQRTDIHALGAVLYELATGQRRAPHDTPSRIIQDILSEFPKPPRALNPQLSDGLERVILKCLEKDPAGRYASAADLLADLDRLAAGDPSGLIAGRPLRRGRPGLRPRPLAAVGALALGLAILGLAFDIGGLRGLLTGRSNKLGTQSLAVLPLKNISPDPAQEYMADGLTDSLITELGQISTLRVISSTSVARYKKTDQSLPQIAKELNAGMVVEGSILRSGDRVRIMAKLIEPAGERQLWARSFERSLGDILDLQSEIAGEIAREIGIRLSEEARLQMTRRKAVHPEAMDAYLKGVFSRNPDDFERAIRIDPDFALAYVAVAESHYFSGFFGSVPPREAFLKTKEAALKALEKDNTLGEAHGYLALALLHYDLNWAEAEKAFKRAFELNPSLAMLHHLYAHYLMAINRMDESMAESKLALELDPFTSAMTFCTGWHCLTTEGYDEAIELARKGLQMSPNSAWAHVILGWAYEQKSMTQEAVGEFQEALKAWKDNSLPLAGLGHVYGISGRTKEAGEILDKLLEMSKQRYVPAYDIAVVYAGLGDKPKALEWLTKAYEERSGFLVYIKCDRRFDGLRSEPRYLALLDRVGLPAEATMAN